jgi:hypothetical protein
MPIGLHKPAAETVAFPPGVMFRTTIHVPFGGNRVDLAPAVRFASVRAVPNELRP